MFGSVRSDGGAHPAMPAPHAAPAAAAPRTVFRLSWAVALAWLAAHLALLPPALEDIDSINFALGLRDFDPARHQPHPPGYPIYIALGKVSKVAAVSAVPSLGEAAADAFALSIWSALAGAVCLLLIAPMLLYVGRLARVDLRAQAMSLLVMLPAAPLFWMSGLRPLSDMPGLAAAIAAQVLLLRACAAGAQASVASLLPLAAGAAAAGFATGVRSQIAWLTAPLVIAAIVCHRGAGWVRAVAAAGLGLAAGATLWAVPLIVASGGLEAYLAALDGMARADFTNVRMLATTPSVRALAFALIDTFVRPWGAPELALAVLVPAALGGLALVWRTPRVAAWILIAFGPYLAMHLLFQETEHIRYALPVLVPVTWMAAAFVSLAGGRLGLSAAAALATAALIVVVPASRAYADRPLPASEAVSSAVERQARSGGVVGAHFDFARLLAVTPVPAAAVLPSPVFGERFELVKYWMAGGTGPVWFVANPARTDLELIDPASRRMLLRTGWTLPRDWFLGGIRPSHGDLIHIDSPPGWVAGEGWHLTREELILSERRGRPEATLHVRRRDGPVVALLGGELAAGASADVAVTLDGRPVWRASLTAAAPRFSARLALEPGALAGPGPFAELRVNWSPGAGQAQVHLRHFDLQSPDRFFWVYSHGWHDRELDPKTDREWRWTSGRADLRVHTASRDVDIQIAGEVPIADLEGPPTVTITAGGTLLRTMRPAGPFTASLRIAAQAIDAADGVLTIATDRTFVPHARTGSGDLRELGLRIYELRVAPVLP